MPHTLHPVLTLARCAAAAAALSSLTIGLLLWWDTTCSADEMEDLDSDTIPPAPSTPMNDQPSSAPTPFSRRADLAILGLLLLLSAAGISALLHSGGVQ